MILGAELIQRKHESVGVVAEVPWVVCVVELPFGRRYLIEIPVRGRERRWIRGFRDRDVEVADVREAVDVLVANDETVNLVVPDDDGIGQEVVVATRGEQIACCVPEVREGIQHPIRSRSLVW